MKINRKLIAQLEQKLDGMSKAHRKIAECIIEDPERIDNMSISELAEACDVGCATISRFCSKMDLHGYLGLKVALFNYEDVEQGEELLLPKAREEEALSADSLLDKFTTALKKTEESLNRQTVREVAELLKQARRITFYGMGNSHFSATMGFNKFFRGLPNVNMVPEGQLQFVSASLSNEGDVALIVSYSGATKESVELARIVKSRGAKVVCISHYEKSPISAFTDYILLNGGEEKYVNTPSLVEQTCTMYIFEVLYTAYAKENKEQVRINEALSSRILLDKVF